MSSSLGEPIKTGEANTGAIGRVKYLDGWRAIAVAIVILSHVTGLRPELSAWNFYLPSGQVGVGIFFFISGLVVSRSALGEIQSSGSYSAGSFYIRRAFRIIFPLSLYVAVCWELGRIGVVDFDDRKALRSLLYTCNIEPLANCGWLGVHTWTLAFEEQFYLLFPIAIGILSLGRLPNIAYAAIVAVVCLLPLVYPQNYVGRVGYFMTYGLFIAGYLVATNETVITRMIRRRRIPLLAVALTFVLIIPVVAKIGLPRAVAGYYELAYVIFIPTMVLCVGAISGVAGALSGKFITYIGRISYSIYLWQQLAVSDMFDRKNVLIEIGAVIGVIALAALLFELFERRLIRLGTQLAERWRERKAAVGASSG